MIEIRCSMVLFGHAKPLELSLESCDANGVINDTLHSLGQDDQSKVQHDFFDHVVSFPLASHDTKGIINGTSH